MMRIKVESEKAGLKFNIQKMNRGIQSHHFIANRWGKSGNSDIIYFLGSKITAVTAPMKLNDTCSLELLWWLRWLSICLQCGRPRFDPWAGKIPWRRKWQSTPVLLPGKFHGLKSLVGDSPWGSKESDTTERLDFNFQ